MSKVKCIAKLLLILFSPVILVAAARVMHAICMWLLGDIAPLQETQYLATLLTTVSFVIVGLYAFYRWVDD